MSYVDDSVEIKGEALRSVKIRMQQGESSGRPVYSNIVSAQSGQSDVVMLDFGFLDPKIMISLNNAAKSGGKMPDYINAKMSCRIAINSDATNRLAMQLEQLLDKKNGVVSHQGSLDSTEQVSEAEHPTSGESSGKAGETKQSGFRFPWSKRSK